MSECPPSCLWIFSSPTLATLPWSRGTLAGPPPVFFPTHYSTLPPRPFQQVLESWVDVRFCSLFLPASSRATGTVTIPQGTVMAYRVLQQVTEGQAEAGGAGAAGTGLALGGLGEGQGLLPDRPSPATGAGPGHRDAGTAGQPWRLHSEHPPGSLQQPVTLGRQDHPLHSWSPAG